VDDRTCRAIIAHLGKGFSDFDSAIKGSYKAPKSDNSSWILTVDHFKSWNAQQTSPLLWIHGKAGTGQNSIASSVLETLNKTKDENSIVASFFCDQGDETRRSLSSLLKLLIRQIIDLNQDLAFHLLTDATTSKKTGGQQFDPDLFSKPLFLWDALLKMARDLPSGCIYIVLYGVEQLASDSLRDLLQLLINMPTFEAGSDEQTESPSIQWMLLSRSGRPEIQKALKPKALEINLDDSENADHVSDALRQDISARVDELHLPAPIAYFVKRHIHSRAEDNSIYVSLAVQELKNARASGKTMYAETRALLESFPYGLTEMYEHIRKRILAPGVEKIEYTKEVLRCRILARRAPTLRELALMADLPLEDRNDLEKLKSYIIRCGAFLTLRGNELDEDNMTVEWIDISAQEHLEKYAKDDLALELKEMQHGIIALRCLSYCYTIAEQRASKDPPVFTDEANQSVHEDQETMAAVPDHQDQPSAPAADEHNDDNEDEIEKEENDVEQKDADNEVDPSNTSDMNELDNESIIAVDDGTILAYAVQYWVEHAKLAPTDVIEEFDTTHAFWEDESSTRQAWWSENEGVHAFPDQTDVSALHIATITGFSNLVEHLLKHGWDADLDKEDSLGFQPLYYACSNGDFETVEILLGAGADPNAVSYKGKVPALYGAAVQGHKDVVECLLDRDADIDACCEESGSALYGAATENRIDVLQFLVERGAEVNTTGGRHKRALNLAAYNGDLVGVQTLVEHGADIDPDEPYSYGSALGAAARRGHADVVKFLLGKGWNPTKHIRNYESFLAAAATYGHLTVVEALIETETRITVLEQALQAASHNGKTAVVKAILDHTPTLRHQKAFMIAADYGRDEILKLLWPRGIQQDQLDTALYNAADHEHAETVKLLLEFGANPNAEGPEYVFKGFYLFYANCAVQVWHSTYRIRIRWNRKYLACSAREEGRPEQIRWRLWDCTASRRTLWKCRQCETPHRTRRKGQH
jgi:ankyrin repeat protein